MEKPETKLRTYPSLLTNIWSFYFHKRNIFFARISHRTQQISIIKFVLICDTADSHPLEVWDAEEDLHHRAEVASVAQIFDARVPRTKHGLQLHSRLLDHLPLADPWPGVIFPVMSVLRLSEGERLCLTFWTSSPKTSSHNREVLLFSASAACQFQNVTSDQIYGGPTQPPPPQKNIYL